MEELRRLDLLATPQRPSPRPIQWDDITRLTYLNAVIKVPSAALQSCPPLFLDVHVIGVDCESLPQGKILLSH